MLLLLLLIAVLAAIVEIEEDIRTIGLSHVVSAH
jgi:hypothetical protein